MGDHHASLRQHSATRMADGLGPMSRWEASTTNSRITRTMSHPNRHLRSGALVTAAARATDPAANSRPPWIGEYTTSPNRIAAGMATETTSPPLDKVGRRARLGISAIAAHSLCPSLGIANLASDAGFDNGCRHVAELEQVVGSVGGGHTSSSTIARLPTSILKRAMHAEGTWRASSIPTRAWGDSGTSNEHRKVWPRHRQRNLRLQDRRLGARPIRNPPSRSEGTLGSLTDCLSVRIRSSRCAAGMVSADQLSKVRDPRIPSRSPVVLVVTNRRRVLALPSFIWEHSMEGHDGRSPVPRARTRPKDRGR